MRRALVMMTGVLLASATPAFADGTAFHAGSVIKNYGNTAQVPDSRLGPDTKLKVAFDISKPGGKGLESRYLTTPARFLNMHAGAGVLPENMKIAIVVHGGAHRDLMTAKALGEDNPNAGLIAELVAFGARIELCGQTAAFYDLTEEDLLPGVTIALSAMTSHALLQQEGYTLNPF